MNRRLARAPEIRDPDDAIAALKIVPK